MLFVVNSGLFYGAQITQNCASISPEKIAKLHTLNIRFRRSDYVGLAVISSGLGVVSACWFAMGLLGITMADITAIWHNIESVMIEEMNQTPPQWPMILT